MTRIAQPDVDADDRQRTDNASASHARPPLTPDLPKWDSIASVEEESRLVLGRRITLAFCIAVVAISVATISFMVSAKGAEALPPRLVRLALTILLVAGIYLGSIAAKWIGIVLMYVGGLAGLAVGALLLMGLHPSGLFPLVTTIVYVAFATLLLAPGPVRDYVQHGARIRHGWQPPPAPPMD